MHVNQGSASKELMNFWSQSELNEAWRKTLYLRITVAKGCEADNVDAVSRGVEAFIAKKPSNVKEILAPVSSAQRMKANLTLSSICWIKEVPPWTGFLHPWSQNSDQPRCSRSWSTVAGTWNMMDNVKAPVNVCHQWWSICLLVSRSWCKGRRLAIRRVHVPIAALVSRCLWHCSDLEAIKFARGTNKQKDAAPRRAIWRFPKRELWASCPFR